MHRQSRSQETTPDYHRVAVYAKTAQRYHGWTDLQTASPQSTTVLTQDLTELLPLPQRVPRWRRHRLDEQISPSEGGGDDNNSRKTAPRSCLAPILHRTCNPTRHPNTNQKNEVWNLPEAKKRTLIVGDSNLSNIPPFAHSDLQIESYPGAKFQHAVELLRKAKPNSRVETVVLSFGINERSRRTTTVAVKTMEAAVAMAETAFPAAKIFVPLVNFSERLEQREKRVVWELNAAIRAQNHLPKLQEQDFKTGRDNIHWTAETGRKMLGHWLAHLN